MGNDIVDLCDAESAGKARHRRFIERVFCADERRVIRDSVDPDRVLWLHWAAKEAAFKIVSKLQPRPAFVHARFAVTVDGPLPACPPECGCQQLLSATVEYEHCSIALAVCLSHAFVHAYGAASQPHASIPPQVIPGVAKVEPDARDRSATLADRFSPAERDSIHSTESALVRLHARSSLARHLNLPEERLQIVRLGPKGSRQPPRVLIDGELADLDLSLSHHGDFVAWAFAANGSASAGFKSWVQEAEMTSG